MIYKIGFLKYTLARLPLRVAARIVALMLGAMMMGQAPALAQAQGQYEGTLNVAWGDPMPGRTGGATLFSLALPDGTNQRLDIGAAMENQAISLFRQRVRVAGVTTATEGGQTRLSVTSIKPLASGEAAGAEAVTGTKRVLFILLRFKGDTQEPHRPNFYTKLTNSRKPPAARWNIPATINGYFHRTSWGKLHWNADVTAWMTLPHTKSYYANCGWSSVCANLSQIASDGMALADGAGHDLTVYDNVNFVLNNDLDCCAWGGSTYYGGRSYGATWEPPWGQEAGTYVHEFGHSIGLPHSGWVYHAYDSPWDMMSKTTSASSKACATYSSANSGTTSSVYCTEPGSGYITAHKDFLGWVPGKNAVVIDKIGRRKVTLEANEKALGRKKKMIRICLKGKPCTGSSAHYLTVEARMKGARYDDGLPGEGVIIHDVQRNRGAIGSGNACFFNTQSGWAVPIDATRGDYNGEPSCNTSGYTYPNYALYNAQFKPGQTYRNRKLGVTVKVLRKRGSTYVVRVVRSK